MLLSRPSESALDNMRCNYTAALLSEISPTDPRSIDERMEAANAPQEAIHLAKALLDLDPSKRLTAEQAIKVRRLPSSLHMRTYLRTLTYD